MPSENVRHSAANSGDGWSGLPRWMEGWIAPEPNSGCWIWLGPVSGGYGRVSLQGARFSAHRVSFEALCGPIPDGKEIDHLCRVRCCVNPGHLEAVTHRENLRRASVPSTLNAAKTHCDRGHQFDSGNTRNYGKRHRRVCLKCDLRRKALFRLRRTQAPAEVSHAL